MTQKKTLAERIAPRPKASTPVSSTFADVSHEDAPGEQAQGKRRKRTALYLEIPPALKIQLDVEAARRQIPLKQLVIEVLTSSLGN